MLKRERENRIETISGLISDNEYSIIDIREKVK